MYIDDLIEQIDENKRLRHNGRDKIANTLKCREMETLPLIFWRPGNTSAPGKTYNLKEQFYDKEKMLTGYLEEIAACAHNAFDARFCIRPNFGTIFIPAVFGLEYKVFEDKYPWLCSHMAKEEIKKFSIPDLDRQEMMAQAVEYIRYFKKTVPEYIHVYQPDTQGPFDIAHLIFGDDLFYEMYDDPGFVHELMEICTDMYIKVSKELKEAIGEEIDTCYHGHALVRGIYMENGGVRISEDSATLISPEHIDKFVIPYVQKALREFNGGFIHFCGKNEYLLDAFLQLDEVRAVNFGNPEMYDFTSTMKKFINKNKCCFGVWPEKENESISEYIRRMKGASEDGTKGLLLHFDERMYPEYSCEQILEMWEA